MRDCPSEPVPDHSDHEPQLAPFALRQGSRLCFIGALVAVRTANAKSISGRLVPCGRSYHDQPKHRN